MEQSGKKNAKRYLVIAQDGKSATVWAENIDDVLKERDTECREIYPVEVCPADVELRAELIDRPRSHRVVVYLLAQFLEPVIHRDVPDRLRSLLCGAHIAHTNEYHTHRELHKLAVSPAADTASHLHTLYQRGDNEIVPELHRHVEGYVHRGGVLLIGGGRSELHHIELHGLAVLWAEILLLAAGVHHRGAAGADLLRAAEAEHDGRAEEVKAVIVRRFAIDLACPPAAEGYFSDLHTASFAAPQMLLVGGDAHIAPKFTYGLM